MRHDSLEFSCGDISLEGAWHLPAGKGPYPAVVVCHPHPLFGGDMHNNVVLALCCALARSGIAALRFNFRGVGRSGGSHGHGEGEEADVVAALDLVISGQGVDPERVGLAGYSFGAGVALPVALRDGRVKALALISPWPAAEEVERIQGWPQPKLLVWGDRDEFAARGLEAAFAKLKGSYQVVPGADHFWRGHEDRLGETVSRFFASALGV
ncbi:MAG: alpha/beta fold hydrolase [Chloroflexota bacterium]